MIHPEKLQTLPSWSKSQVNRWADFIELNCLYGGEGIVSRDDASAWFHEDTMSDAWSQDGGTRPQGLDRRDCFIDSCYALLQYRARILQDIYPFRIEDGCLYPQRICKEKNWHYLFLLLCSSIYFMERQTLFWMTHLFERYCKIIMQFMMPVNARTELFGTSRSNSCFCGTLYHRFCKLAACLKADVTPMATRMQKYYAAHSGDGGLDIVSFVDMDDAPYTPLALGQCTCSYDEWADKQGSISESVWRERIFPLAPFWQFMFVPFSCRMADGTFEQPGEIRTCLMDRRRLLWNVSQHYGNLCQDNEMQEIQQEFLQWEQKCS